MGISLKYRLMLYLLLGLLPFLLVSLYFFVESYHSRRTEILLGHMGAAEATSATVVEFVQGILEAQQMLQTTIVTQDLTPAQTTAYFEAAHQQLPILDTIGFATPSGMVIAGYPSKLIGVNVGDRKHFLDISAGKEYAVSSLLTVRPTGNLGFIIAHRVSKKGKFAGMIFCAISPDVLRRFVSMRTSSRTGYSILDQDGMIIVSTVSPPSLEAEHRDRSWIPSVRRAMEGERAAAASFVDTTDGVERMGASVPVPAVGWVVTVFEPVSSALAAIRMRTMTDSALLILLTSALLVLASYFGERLARPIKVLARRADAVAHGDFTQRVLSSDRSEIGTLASAFNNMTVELQRFSTQQRQARERALFLADISELLSSSLDTDSVLRMVAEKTVEFLGDLVVIFQSEPGGSMKPIAMKAKDEWVANTVSRLLDERPISVGMGIVGKALEQDGTVFIPDISALESSVMRHYLEPVNASSTIAAPMKMHGKTVGALSVSTIGRPLTEDQILIVEEISRRLGLALENLRLFEETVEREEFQASLAELAVAVSSTLEPEAVLNTICDHTRILMDADGVYIWVNQEDEHRLVGGAACGYRAEHFIGLFLNLDEKTSGAVRALNLKRGYVVHDVPSWPHSTHLIDETFEPKASIFQPLVSAGKVFGVMVVTDTKNPDRFDERDLRRVGVLAGYAASALANASEYARERRIAETLQRSLLSDIPPTANHFELAHFYSPARHEASIGGDFYDFIKYEDGCSSLVVGDVSGKGLEAAVVTAMTKYIIRAYAAENSNPLPVITRANDALVKYTSPDLFITLVYCLLHDSERRITYASAGHMPMIHYHHSDGKTTIYNPTGIVLGIEREAVYEEASLYMDRGDVLLMYTDGVTDALSPGGERLGEQRLIEIVESIAEKPASEFVDALVARLRTFSGGEFSDDVAILAVRVPPP
jgi:sigma-B regulation protein RsbU (phosphoserine phosphatase)